MSNIWDLVSYVAAVAVIVLIVLFVVLIVVGTVKGMRKPRCSSSVQHVMSGRRADVD